MSDYYGNINSADYLYKAKVYLQETGGVYKTNVIVKMELNASNFNFDLAQHDGSDFRLAEQSNGGGTFKMWIAIWDYVSKFASIWFNIPYIFADQYLELTAFWGNNEVNSITDSSILNALFLYEFDSSPLDYTKWQSNSAIGLTQSLNNYGYRLAMGTDTVYLETIDQPLTDVKEWIFEAGGFVEGGTYTPSRRSFRLDFEGTQNPFSVQFYGEDGSYGLSHNIENGSSYQTVPSCPGLEVITSSYTYNNIYVAYKESNDRSYIRLYNRPNLEDYSESWERSVEDETHLTHVRIYGYQSSGPIFRLKWLLLRPYSDDAEVSDFDLSNLYITSDIVNPQPIDYEEYGVDVTSIGFEHKSSSGNPYNLSDNTSDSIGVSWVTDEASSDAWASINFGGGSDITDESFRHYDSGHVRYLNASKLSNDTDDVNDNNYWQGTTASGYACIDFGLNNNKAISGLAVQAVPGATDNMPKDFVFQASNSDPRLSAEDRWVTLEESNFDLIEDKQYFFFDNDSEYRYYKLKVLNTFTGDDIKLYTWQMYEHVINTGKKIVSKLRLLPLVGGDYEYNFTKNIKFYGSNDGVVWSVLIESQDTTSYELNLANEIFSIGQEIASQMGGAFDGVTTDGNSTGSWYAYYSGGNQTDGWTGQDFGAGNEQAVVRYRIYSDNSNYSARSWTFEASTTGAWTGEEVTLDTQTNYIFSSTLEWHNFNFSNASDYRYYRINVYENNGSGTYLVIRELEMYSNNNLEFRPTYTPFYDHAGDRWQEYSFDNITPYYMYKLECINNWGAATAKIIIAEWSMHEKISEQYTNRILAGISNDFNSVWLLSDSTFDDISFLAANNVLNMASNDKLIYYQSFSGDISGQGPPTVGVGNYNDTYLDITTGSIYIKDIPIYSGDKTGSGSASASFYQPGYPPENAFDDNDSTYIATTGYTEEVPQWLNYDLGLGNEEVVNQITLLTLVGGYIIDFTLKASNDGVVWTTLLVETGVLDSDGKTLFNFTNETAYRHYRIYADKCHQTGHGLYAYRLSEMELTQLAYYDWRLESRGSEINDVNAI